MTSKTNSGMVTLAQVCRCAVIRKTPQGSPADTLHFVRTCSILAASLKLRHKPFASSYRG